MGVHHTRRWIIESLRRTAQAPSIFWIILLVILAYASVLRLYELDRYPILFNQDETVMGYDAWSLWTTGRDHHGSLLPIHFTTFGDYVPPTANYLTAPFVGLLGLSEFSTRLPIALMSIVTIGLVAVLGRRWFGPAAGLLAALFLTISSWHINYSRIGFPGSFVPFLIVCSLYAFTRAATNLEAGQKNRASAAWFAVSALCFALLTGVYPTMKIEAPLLVGACLLAAARLFWHHRRMAVLWLGIYLLGISPLVIDQVVRWNIVGARFNQVSTFGNPDWPLDALRLYADHYNPSALAFTAFRGGVGIYPPFVGGLFWLDLPLSLIAAFALARRRRARLLAFSLPILLGIWFITYPIADSLTDGDSSDSRIVGHPHEIRSYNLLPLPELLAGYGAVVAWQQLRKYRWGWLPAAGGAVGLAGLIAFFNLRFLPFYFDNRVVPALAPYNYGLRSALDAAARTAQPCDSIWVDDATQAYIYFLFLTRYSPARFQSWAATVHGYFSAFDQFHAGMPDSTAPAPSVKPECQGQPYHALLVTRSNFAAPGWEPLDLGQAAPPGMPWHVNVTISKLPWPTPPPEAVGLKATLGDQISLEGYQLRRDGRSLVISLYWRTYGQLPENYEVFVHVMHGNALIAQQDGIPSPPPHAWVPGQLVTTSHRVELPDNTPEFDSIYVGVYRYPTLDRLSTVQNNLPREDGRVLIWTNGVAK